MKNNRFPWPIGIELTSIPIRKMEDYQLENLSYDITDILKHERIPYYRSYPDDHAIEVASKKLFNWDTTKNWFTSVRKIMSSKGLSPHHPRMVCGGGHIHVGSLPKRFHYEVFRDSAMRPYLPWVFSQPDEQESCDNPLSLTEYQDPSVEWFFLKGIQKSLTDEQKYLLYKVVTIPYALFGDVDSIFHRLVERWYYKQFAVEINNDHNTVEFRFFEAPLDWSEQKDQIDFTFAYLKYLMNRYKKGYRVNVSPMTRESMNAISKNEARSQFNDLLRTLRLSPDRYAKYVERNLFPRWEKRRKRY